MRTRTEHIIIITMSDDIPDFSLSQVLDKRVRKMQYFYADQCPAKPNFNLALIISIYSKNQMRLVILT